MKVPKHLQIDRLSLDASSHTGGWIVSYADMMTIILTFFILLLSISTIARTKYDLLVQAFTGEKAGNLMEVKEEIDKVIEEQNLGGEITTKLNKDGLTIEFSNALLFNSGDSDIKESGIKAFAPIRTHLKDSLETSYGLVVEGYTDDVPISNTKFSSNWELSTGRAIHVMNRMVEAGVDARRVSVKGYANTRPATDVDISDAAVMESLSEAKRDEVRAANRRVIIRIDALDPEVVARINPTAAAAPTPPAAGTSDAPAKELGPFEMPSAPETDPAKAAPAPAEQDAVKPAPKKKPATKMRSFN